MYVGVARIVLHVPGARSLKDRRRVVRSFKDRVRGKLPVSIAEVGDLERTQVATLGISVVSREATRCQELLSAAARMARGVTDAVVADIGTEVVSFGEAGSGVRGGIEQLSPEEDGGGWNDDYVSPDGDEEFL